MTEQSSDYYDKVYQRPDTVYRKGYKDAPGTFRYMDHTLAAMQHTGCNAMIEIGSGMGHLLDRVLTETDIRAYIGMDFSKVGVEKCLQIMSSRKTRFLDEGDVLQTDFNTIEALPSFVNPELVPMYVSHETLEHFEKDTECLSLIPIGSWVCISVPDFGGTGHVRWGDARYWQNRYAHLLEYHQTQTMGNKGKQHSWFLAKRV